MEWTRRALVKGGALTLLSLSLGGTPPFLGRVARAAANTRRRVLVTLFQRGAMDGLMAVTPVADPALAAARPGLFMNVTDAASGLTDLDGRFALHPGFAALVPLYREGRLAVVHGVGSTYKTRSHFDAQDYMENGTPGVKGTSSGWLNRAAGLLRHTGTAVRSVALADKLPRSLYRSSRCPAASIPPTRDSRSGPLRRRAVRQVARYPDTRPAASGRGSPSLDRSFQDDGGHDVGVVAGRRPPRLFGLEDTVDGPSRNRPGSRRAGVLQHPVERTTPLPLGEGAEVPCAYQRIIAGPGATATRMCASAS